MIASVRESKARLSELISKAKAGEDVYITVRGKPSVKLVPVAANDEGLDFGTWASRRRARLDVMPVSSSSEEILNDLREERGG